tara:strand:+ start:329 stop:718 length:390 start_codon:yes stop_codon:yes gene_type:complete
LVKLRYLGVRPVKDAPPVKSGKLVLHNLVVGSGNVSFNDANVYLAGTEYTPERWLELRRRIDKVLIDRGQIEEVAPPQAPWEGKSSSFLTNNTMPILEHKQGYFNRPPWWLRWLYSAVVTKERYHGDSY